MHQIALRLSCYRGSPDHRRVCCDDNIVGAVGPHVAHLAIAPVAVEHCHECEDVLKHNRRARFELGVGRQRPGPEHPAR
eukprot:5337950-Alexandrium_andersonii.AAC.1